MYGTNIFIIRATRPLNINRQNNVQKQQLNSKNLITQPYSVVLKITLFSNWKLYVMLCFFLFPIIIHYRTELSTMRFKHHSPLSPNRSQEARQELNLPFQT